MHGVSVVTPTHNAQAHIERNVRSVAAQTHPVREHIIIDDGSNDQTISAVRRLQQEFSHLRLLSQSHSGAGEARNRGIAAAKGRYISFLDSDDTWTASKLEAQVSFMISTGAPFTYGDYEIVDARTQRKIGRYASPPETSYREFLSGCPIGCLTAAYDQQTLGKHYMPLAKRGQDWGLWLRLTRDGTVGRRYPGCFATYSLSRNSLSSSKLRKAADIYRIYRAEGIGPMQSIRYLIPHALSSRRKLGTP